MRIIFDDILGGKGNWYPADNKPKYVLGVAFRPGIKGYWFYEGQAYAVLINARKGQPLSAEGIKFLARGVHELYCRDDPNNPIPLIIDLSEDNAGSGRRVKIYVVAESDGISLAQFDECLAQFFISLEIAGVQLPEAPPDGIVDLFRR